MQMMEVVYMINVSTALLRIIERDYHASISQQLCDVPILLLQITIHLLLLMDHVILPQRYGNDALTQMLTIINLALTRIMGHVRHVVIESKIEMKTM